MKLRKIVSVITVASMLYWAPSVIPARAVQEVFVTCGTAGALLTIDTAFAIPAPIPCPPVPHGPFPWIVIIFGASVVSVISNAIYISQTQCRELTQQEAWWSVGLPFFGFVFDQLSNKCHLVHHHH